MADAATSEGAAPRPTSLVPGKVLGGRFVVEGSAEEDPTRRTVRARDNKTGKPIALRILPNSFTGAEPREFLKAQCRLAATLRHENIVATYGLGTDGSLSFVASEWLDGSSLAELIARRGEHGEPFELERIEAIIQKICAALEAAGRESFHGTLRPEIVFVGPGDQVKVGDFGTGRALLHAAGLAAFKPSEQKSFPPEVSAGDAPDARSDMYGIGAILHALLTGSAPKASLAPTAETHPEGGPDLDRLLAKCLERNPDFRLDLPIDINAELRRIVAMRTHGSTEIELDFEQSNPAIQLAPGSGDSIDVKLDSINAPPLPEAPVPVPIIPETDPPKSTSGDIDLKALIERLTADDAPCWMAVVDAVDHGPFTARALIDRIVRGEVLGRHFIFDIDRPDLRHRVIEHPDFGPFVKQAELKAAADQEKASLQKAERVEKTGNAFKILVSIGVVAAVATAITLFVLNRQAAEEERRADVNFRGNLYETGEIDITGTAQILEPPPRTAQNQRGNPGQGGTPRGGNSPGGAMTYEEAMNQPVDLGDVSQAGGEQQLTAGEITNIMNQHINSLYSCVVAEQQRGGSLSSVRINLAISGNGQVAGASPAEGSPTFRGCIQSQTMRIRFPSFSAPRMGASFRFSVD